MAKRTNGAAPVKAAPRPRPRSGTNITESRRRELGYGSIKVRLPLDALAILAAEAERSGYTRAEILDACIRIYCKSDPLAKALAEV
ncbi:MAG TPA: hypothetical protein VG734_25705 [Lacunisphaera sp.]|nr:hypothetical protein [Lacunisphaera sp.]